jgi:hypothetical protein
MEAVMEKIPKSLREDLSKSLINIVLGSQDRNSVPSELAKKVIYLWRQDQLSSPSGIETLLEAALLADSEATHSTLNQLGLKEVATNLSKLS